MFPVTAINKILAAIDFRDHQHYAVDCLSKDVEDDPDLVLEASINKVLQEVYNRGREDGKREQTK